MNHKDAYTEIIKSIDDQNTANRMLEELSKYRVIRDPKLDDKLPILVGELHDRDVEIGDFIGSSRRIVFEGKYKNKKVVIKFSHALHTFNHDERQQQKEEVIWKAAQKNGEGKYFAETFFGNTQSDYVVQEFCEDITPISSDEDWEDLPEIYKELSYKYGFNEVSLGTNSKGNRVFVDYGY